MSVMLWGFLGGLIASAVGIPLNLAVCGGLESMVCNRWTSLPVAAVGILAGIAFGMSRLQRRSAPRPTGEVFHPKDENDFPGWSSKP